MVKVFVTGDNHFGKKYDRYPEVKEKLINSRFETLDKMIKKAEDEGCDLFVITGDLFDNTNTIKVKDVKRVVEIIASFTGNVIVLPGNHDYYTGNEKVWNDFNKALENVSHNVTLITEYKKYTFEAREDEVAFYPAFCDSKHSKQNKLGWIKNEDINSSLVNIGLAHGAIKGITPDMNGEYFLMSESELMGIPMDAWLIGHTHIPYPDDLKWDSDTEGYRIFNAGTHEQTDLHNNTEGNGFIITIEKTDGIAKIKARKYVSGQIRYYDLRINVTPNSDSSLYDSLSKALSDIRENSVIRVVLSGSVKQTEYSDKERIYKEILERFLTYEVDDSELSEEITLDKIQAEFAETSLASMLLEELLDNPTELQMAYQLLKECKE